MRGTGRFRVSGLVWVLEVEIHIHTIVKNSDHDDFGFRASPVKDDMAALAKFSVSGSYIFSLPAYVGLARKQLEGIIKLLEVFIALPLSPFFSGKTAYFQ